MKKDKKKIVDLVLDKSGSMGGLKLDKAKMLFMEKLEDTVGGNDSAGVIAFDTRVEEIHPLKRFTRASKEEMKDKVSAIRAGGNTALYDAIGTSIDRLVDADRDDKLIVVCLTDGMNNSSTRFETPEELVRYANSKGVDLEIILIGLGDSVNEVALRTITEGVGGTYIPARETSEDMGRAVDEAGDVIRHGRSRRRNKREPRNSGKRHTRHLHGYTDKCHIRYSGGRRREDIDHMEKIAYGTISLLENVIPLSVGGIVPVYVWDRDKFQRVFGSRVRPSRYCGELYHSLGHMDDRDLGCRYEDHENREHPRGNTLGGFSDIGFCGGELVAVFVDDIAFGEHRQKEVTSPGIYMMDLSRYGRTGLTNMRSIMSYMAVCSTIYYATSRDSVVVRRKLTDIDSLSYGTISLLCNDDAVIDEFVKRCDLVGTCNLPLHLVKKGGDPRDVLSSLYDELPLFELLSGNITYDTEGEYIKEVSAFLKQI